MIPTAVNFVSMCSTTPLQTFPDAFPPAGDIIVDDLFGDVSMSAALLPRVRALLDDRRAEGRSDADLLGAFVGERDESAFASLVRRHGPLVLATARRVVGNSTDAEDVFQAAFLLLSRQAYTIRNPGAVGGWLHGVASRMARTARRAAARRRSYEARVPEPRPAKHCDSSSSEGQKLIA